MLNFGCLGWVVGLVLFLQCFFFVAHARHSDPSASASQTFGL